MGPAQGSSAPHRHDLRHPAKDGIGLSGPCKSSRKDVASSGSGVISVLRGGWVVSPLVTWSSRSSAAPGWIHVRRIAERFSDGSTVERILKIKQPSVLLPEDSEGKLRVEDDPSLLEESWIVLEPVFW